MSQLVSKFEKNGLEEVRVSLTQYKGYDLIDLRVYYIPPSGDPVPTRKGLTLSVDLYRELKDAVLKLGEALKGKQ